MRYTVYIKSVNGVPEGDWGFTAYQGFQGRLDIVFVEDQREVPANRGSIFI